MFGVSAGHDANGSCNRRSETFTRLTPGVHHTTFRTCMLPYKATVSPWGTLKQQAARRASRDLSLGQGFSQGCNSAFGLFAGVQLTNGFGQGGAMRQKACYFVC